MTDPTALFLHQLYRDFDAGWLTLFSINRTTGDRTTDWAPVDGIDHLAAVAHQRAATSCVWFGAATRTTRLTTGRGGANDCAHIPGLWLDIDIAGPTHATTNPLPPDLDAALELVDTYGIPPTAIVHTGGGIQPWWLFNEPLDAEDAAAILPRWGHTWSQIAERHGWHLDNVFDLSRIMRLPGTTNRKTDQPRPVTIHHADWDHRLGYDDLDQYLHDPPPPAQATPTRTVPYIGPERPGDAYNARHRGADVLADLGFTLHRTDRNGDQHFHWPSASNDTSATVYADDGHVTLWSETFTGAHPPAAIRRPYDPYGLLVATKYHGDHSAATADLRAKGYGSAPDGDLTAWIPTPDADTAWPTPEPLEHNTTDTPAFPIHVLPDWMADHATQVADAYQVPVDLPATIALGVLAVAATGRATIALDGSAWTEHVNLYQAIAMPPGAGKSPVYKAMTKPLARLEQRLQQGARRDVYAAEERRRQLEARIAKMQKDDDADPMDIADLRAQLDEHPPPASPRLLAEDVTPEALVELLAAHHGRMAIISDEGGVFDMMAGQYAEKGRTANLAVYLQGWSAGTIRRDRKSAPPIVVAEAVLNMCIATQPSVVARIADSAELAGRGLTARFMYSIPASLVGYRDRRAVLTHLDATITDEFGTRIEELGWRLAGNLTPTELHTTPAATETFLAWDQSIEVRQRPDGDLAPMAEWCSKLRASVLRTAALIHLAEGGTAQVRIPPATIERAIEVGDYWIAHARAIHAMWRDQPAVRDARTILEWATTRTVDPDDDPDVFTARDIYAAKRRTFEKANDVVAPLTELVERGWVLPLDQWPIKLGTPGKDSPRFRLHPDARSLIGQKTHVSPKPVETVDEVRAMRAMRAKGSAILTTTTPQITPFPAQPSTCAHSAHGAHDRSPSPPPTLRPDGIFGDTADP